jgi:uncharacterized membrane protein (DUF4010 family)
MAGESNGGLLKTVRFQTGFPSPISLQCPQNLPPLPLLNPETYLRPGLALAIGLLIGLQRERAKGAPAGIRTFALIALSGYLIGLLAIDHGGWIVFAGILFLAAILVMGNVMESRLRPEHGGGATTEIAALLVFGIGVYLSDFDNERSPAVLFAGVTALLLYYKTPLHQFVRGLGQEDVRAMMQFVLITLVVLPVLPNRTFGPYDVVNPFKAWLMVVLIVGIGLAGYLAYRMASSRVGTILSGLLGGLISSTATTASASRFGRDDATRATAAALIISIASAVAIIRVLVEMAVVNGKDLLATAPPIVAFLVVFALLTFLLYRKRSDEVVRLEPPANPAGMKPAILFGLLYVVILLGVAATKDHFGSSGLYVVAVISGLTDMDAITLSTAELMNKGSLDLTTGWRVILIAALANLVFKAGIVAFAGGKAILLRIAPVFGLALAAGLAILFFWPV